MKYRKRHNFKKNAETTYFQNQQKNYRNQAKRSAAPDGVFVKLEQILTKDLLRNG